MYGFNIQNNMEMTTLNTKVNGEWKPTLIDYTKVDGVWKDVVSVWTKIAGEWVNDLKDITFNVNVIDSSSPSIGDFVYNDKSFSTEFNKDKICIGFIVDVLDDKCKVFSCKRACPTEVNICWGNLVNSLPVVSSSRPVARNDMDGRTNTDIILSVKTTDNPQPSVITDYPAANYCNNYSIEGFPKGSWYLPSCGECVKVSLIWQTIKPLLIENELDVPQVQYIWTSTGYYNNDRPAWIHDLNNIVSGENVGHNTNRYGFYDVFPMTEIKISDLKNSVPVNITINEKTITGESPIIVKGRLNHIYNYTISKEDFSPVEDNITIDSDKVIDVSLRPLVTKQRRFFPSGTYTWIVPENVTEIDLFLVGGGAGGVDAVGYYKAGSGSGYTKTYRGKNYLAPSSGTWEGTYEKGRDGNAIAVEPGDVITITVGKGGTANNNGSPTSVVVNDVTYSAEGGYCGTYGNSQNANKGGNGGSGGGGYQGAGGIDGSDGGGTNPGTGQGHTTRDFGEPDGKLNAAGCAGNMQDTIDKGGYLAGSGHGNINSGYGGAGDSLDGPSDGGDGTVLIRYKIPAPEIGIVFGEVQRFTSNTSFTVPAEARYMDAFLVGGGGGGGSWRTWNYTHGLAGNGGCILNEKGIKVNPGETWVVEVGAGGSHATSVTSAPVKQATDGGTTYLKNNERSITYSANGGVGGINSMQGNVWDFVPQYGTYTIYEGEDGSEFYQGSTYFTEDNSLYDLMGNKLANINDLPIYNTTANSRYMNDRGIPEFLEEGNPTHAVTPATCSSLAFPATYGPDPEFCKTSYGTDTWGVYGGGGYGAGGFPGYYANGSIYLGGNGRSGIVCVRFRK